MLRRFLELQTREVVLEFDWTCHFVLDRAKLRHLKMSGPNNTWDMANRYTELFQPERCEGRSGTPRDTQEPRGIPRNPRNDEGLLRDPECPPRF